MSYDLPISRSPNTAMRDLLRQLDRQTIRPPMRPRPYTPPPTPTEPIEPAETRIGAWQLLEDPDSGDLIALHDDGTQRTLATKGPIQ